MERGNHRAAAYAPHRERAYHLGILIGQGVSAWVANDLRTAQPEMLAWAPGSDALQHADLPRYPRSVSFVLLPEWSTLVPDGALSPEQGIQHLGLVHGRLPSGVLRDEPVSTLGATCVYMHDDQLERTVLDRFPNARTLPLQAVLVRGAQRRSAAGTCALLHRSADRVDIAIAREQRLLVSNSFPARSAEDLLYFCLLATERAGLAPDQVALRFGGTHLNANERHLLGRYFADHASANPDLIAAERGSGPEHEDRWMAALEQFACVS